ncbi:protein translocase subunit SecF [Leadbettera azotonutricia]|uniref:Protein-export membrane protein SecF n=1 Tax=Leadbettera azotonutricia (strain ATCC BAA-888 / DSM 13862 / ZAS-9) TaxID=545695 RepID=F5Y8E2_LEAAZ|nr:protein translocase subunit SecF [Leadbettera azotonutricia]AEF81822.1 protein-export membrane protein SecF [Leadbettera azotonutricia ZAS-9]
MKRIIPFSKFFLPAIILSILLAVGGIVGYVTEGFNMGVDFQAGLLQEIQFAPGAFQVTYNGRGNASISLSRTNLTIVISGAGVEEEQHDFPFASYPAVNDLVRGLQAIDGISASASSSVGSIRSSWLVVSAQSSPQLGSVPYNVHYLSPDEQVIPIEDVRSALLPLGTVSVQSLGEPAERRFMVRMEDSDIEGGQGVPAEKIISTLETAFGHGGVAVNKSDYVGSRFSKQLADQAGILLGLTLLLILLYSTIRFKPQYAIGAVLAIVHDGLIMVAFVVWSRMEFNTTTIAAILTILGYSINDTIVIFDRVRESRRIYPDDTFVRILDRSLTETLSRTIITTFTTMLAVLSLFIFTTGSMKDFALALLVGMTSGVYSTIFIACGFVNLWEAQKNKREKRKLTAPAVAVPAKA